MESLQYREVIEQIELCLDTVTLGLASGGSLYVALQTTCKPHRVALARATTTAFAPSIPAFPTTYPNVWIVLLMMGVIANPVSGSWRPIAANTSLPVPTLSLQVVTYAGAFA